MEVEEDPEDHGWPHHSPGGSGRDGAGKEEQVLEKVDTFTQLVVVTVSKLADVMQRFVHDEYSELDAAACELDAWRARPTI